MGNRPSTTLIRNVDATGTEARFNFPERPRRRHVRHALRTDFSHYSIRKGTRAPATPEPTGPTGAISNILVRTTLAAAQTPIMGFKMQGDVKRVLIRAIGPTHPPRTTQPTRPVCHLMNDKSRGKLSGF